MTGVQTCALPICFPVTIGRMLGKSVYRYFLSEEVGFHIQKDVELIQNKTALSYEKNGFPGNRTFVISKNVVTDNFNNPIGIITVFTDITGLKRANEEVLNTKKAELITNTLKLMHLSDLNQSMVNDLVKVTPHTNKEGILLMCNKFYAELLSTEKAELLG